MANWLHELKYDPIAGLSASRNQGIRFYLKSDLLQEKVDPVESLWQLPEPLKIIRQQQANGSWLYPGGGKPNIRSTEDYNQIETYRQLGELVEKYGFNKQHPAIWKAADFLFSCQTSEGDFRGIYGTQYSPNYSAAIMELLIKAGYESDIHVERGFGWLLSTRQNDGGWAIPLRTVGASSWTGVLTQQHTIQPDKTKPFSHLATGVVLRAFAAHPKYRKTEEACVGGELLASRFFNRDKYVDRQGAEFWLKFSYPFWFTDLLSALDSLSLIGIERENPQIKKALGWFISQQAPDGLWKLKTVRGKDKDIDYWISLAICRVLKRFMQ